MRFRQVPVLAFWRPVREIAGTAARLGASDLSERLPVAGHDEFSELAVSINAMLARLEEAFERQRRFTADASHESSLR